MAALRNNYNSYNYYSLYPYYSNNVFFNKNGSSFYIKTGYSYLSANNDITADNYFLEFNIARLGFDLSYYRFYEVLNSNNKDIMSSISSNAYVHFARNERTNFKFGFGIKSIERTKKRYGINFCYKFDYLPQDPFHLNFDLEYSRIGSAEIYKISPSIGIIYNRIEILGGYNFSKFEDQKIEGPEIKTALWF